MILGIEGTAHTLGVGISRAGRVLVNERDKVKPKAGQGFLPRELAEHHSSVFSKVLRKALEKASVSLKEVEAVAVSQGPGIGAPLTLTVSLAKYLAKSLSLPLVGVHHGLAHALIALHDYQGEKPIIIYVSGGNTQILWRKSEVEFEVLGETLDIGVGNAIDVLARKLNLDPPDGVSLSKLAEKGRYVEMPYTVKGMNTAFTGLLTYAEKLIGKIKAEDIAYSFMHTAFAQVLEIAERAFHLKGADGFVLCGGVANAPLLQRMAKALAEENNALFHTPKAEFNSDNGGMIAYSGEMIFNLCGGKRPEEVFPKPKYRFEEVREVLGC